MIEFKLFEVKIKIDFFFVAVVTLFALLDKTGFSLMGILACAVHELGHIVAFFLIGKKPREIAFEAAGIKLCEPYGSLSFCRELFVLSSGSLVNFICFLILSGGLEKGINQINMLAIFHFLIGCFNLLPVSCFDGGKLLKLVLSKLLSEKAIFKISSIIDIIGALAVLCICVIFIVKSKLSLSLVVIAGYVLFSTIVKLM